MKHKLLTTAEVAARLRVKKNTLDKWRLRGRGPRFLKFGSDGASGRVRYTEEAIDEYVAAAEAKGGA
jgi:hypothetical protein